MKNWTIHAMAMAAVMSWGASYAQSGSDDALGIPPTPAEANPNDTDSSNANASGDREGNDSNSAAQSQSQEEDESAPATNSTKRDQSESQSPEPAPQKNQSTDTTTSKDETGQPQTNQNVPRTFAPQSAEDAAQGNMSAQGNANFGPPADIEVGSNVQINPRVQAATSHLDIDDAARARYRWHLGEWWFQNDNGQWLHHRDGQWMTFNEAEYQPPAEFLEGRRPMNRYGASGVVRGSRVIDGSAPPTSVQSANGYYYNAPSYRPVPSRGTYYSTGYRYGGRSFGPYRNNYNNGYYGGYGPGYGTYYNSRNDRYYGYGRYGRGYSIQGDRYRGAVIGSEIGGRVGGRTGAIIGGAIGAEAAED